jgi:choline kinase
MDFDVIITCSGTGSRLKPITNFLNKALIKLGDKAIISHILESYPKSCRFIVTIGYLGDQVMDYININHSDLNIIYVPVSPYEGKNSSLLYSLSKTYEILDKPFIYNACDTYVSGDKKFDTDTAIISKTYIGNQYRRYVRNIENEPADIGELCYTGLCFIKDYEQFKKITLELFESSNYDNNLSDAHVIEKMNIKFIETDNWVDIGNFIALEKARKHFENKICVLEKNDQETYLVGNKILKFFKNEKKVNSLYERAQELSDCVPKCYKRGNFIYYDWIDGVTLSNILEPELLQEFLNWCENNLWIPKKNIDENFFENFYIEKTKKRVSEYIKNHDEPNTDSAYCTINFREIDNIFELLNKIPIEIKNQCLFSRSHGDLVFENVIKTKDSFKLIDWREGFEPCKGSDMLYDIAKMKHNLYFDHNVIKNNLFFIKRIKPGVCLFDPGTPSKNIELLKELDTWCVNKKIDIKTIDLIVSLIQLSSSALHRGEDAHLLFYMGWYNLSKVVQHG